jgi:predicted HAD superfamily Cof-like phosphohydrolase
MTYTPMQNLAEFHDKFDRDGKGRHERPISVSLIRKRMDLIEEEFDEVLEALAYIRSIAVMTFQENNIGSDRQPAGWANLAKELADLLYVVYGTAEELGIPLEAVFNEVHRSNMGKVWDDGTVHYNEISKVLKPDTYTPPDIEKILYE